MTNKQALKLLKNEDVDGFNAWVKQWRKKGHKSIDLDDKNLSGLNLKGVDLADAHLNGSNLRGTILDDADLENARL
ncbi:MAG: pentapeptide repeat-containing protein, partial [Chromatiaceae bacterium]